MLSPVHQATVSVYDETPTPQGTEGCPAVDVSAAVELDRLLFRAPVRLIDAANDFVANVRSLEAAREAIGAGFGASYFAELAPGVAGVDVDLDDDDTAAALIHHLAQWCDDHSIWWCSRRSGGGPGRWHLLAVAGELLPSLRGQVLDLRREWRLSARQLDWRSTLRPLAAPHRSTKTSQLPAATAGLLAELRSGSGSHRLGVAAPRRPRPASLAATSAPLISGELSPLSPGIWKRLQDPGPGYVADRSMTELLVTAELKGAGYSPAEAWQVLADPAHRVGSRARQKGRIWWQTYVWSTAQPTARIDGGRRPRLPHSYTKGYDWRAVTLPMAVAVRRVWSTWATRERHTTEQVAAVVSEYLTRRGTLAAVPAAERSVSEDTGHDRKTVREALRRLCDADVLVLVDRFAYGAQEGQGGGANTYAPNLLALDFSAGSLTPPPSSHTPSPAHPLWLGLPAGSLSLWTALALNGPLPSADLRTAAGYQPPLLNARLSTRQARSLAERLEQLKGRRLLLLRLGLWSLTELRNQPAAPAAGWARWRELRRRHAAERLAFRTVRAADRARFRAAWELGRTEAAIRRASADRIRRARWWRQLSDAEQELRRSVWRTIYADLSPADRARRRELLRARTADAELFDREVMLAA